ncbi:MAG TPA: nitrilase-related carbon-nitrogen hydrolase [Candidatus Thermoplasmatota archaeon]|jgi:predicted amidohydrolase|nr:nitrilase-related carbon-nitrogen hydrolase [Candidatus Thermoplasmatota archaeon]
MDRDVKVALFQLQPALGEPARNVATLAKRVAAAKADLCVFPELYLTGYFNRDALRTLAEPLDGPLVDELRKVAKRSGSHIVVGMPRQGELRGVVHNSSVLVTPGGEAHAYDKVYLPTFSVFEEDIYFGEGHALPTFKTDLGRIGMSICYDLFFPEVTKSLALQGAEILTCISASPTISRTYFEKVLPARAVETTSFLLFTNLVGPQDTLTFWGGAKVFGPLGDLQAEGPAMKEAVTRATLDLEEVNVARLKRPVLRDSRPEWLGLAARLAESALPRDLRALQELHGELCAWSVAGLRMARAGRHALRRDGKLPAEIEADVTSPLKPPVACVLDGLLLSSGCTLGRGNLRVQDGSDVVAAFRGDGRAATVRLRPEARRRFVVGPTLDAALAVLAVPEDELLEVTR